MEEDAVMSTEDETWDRPVCELCHQVVKYGEWGKHGYGKCQAAQEHRKRVDILNQLAEVIRRDGLDESSAFDGVSVDIERRRIVISEESVTISGPILDAVRIRIGDAARFVKSYSEGKRAGIPDAVNMSLLAAHARNLAEVLCFYLGEGESTPPKSKKVKHSEKQTLEI